VVDFSLNHGPPLLAILLLWFAGTGLIAWAGNRDRRTFRTSLAVAGFAGVAGLVAIAASAHFDSPLAAYASAAGAIAVWGWHELSFLTGAVTGPRRAPCPPQARGWARFRDATKCVIHHEIALAATAVLLLTLTFNTPNQAGALIFALLFLLRLSSKLNLFLGATDFSDEMLPAHLNYLKSYFGPRRLHPALVLSVALASAAAIWLGSRALAAPPGTGTAVAATLLAGLAALGALEHLFMALPLRDGALWRWAMPARPARQEYPGRP